MPEDYQVIIVGGGVAGISAALWSAELGIKSVLLEASGELGGQLLWTFNPIKNHLGIEVKNGRELQQMFLKQIESRKIEIRTDCKVIEIDVENKKVKLENAENLSADALVIATGIRRRKLGLENEEKFLGKGILTSGKRDAAKVIKKKVVIVGGGDAALENALILADFAESVTLIHRRDHFRARREFVERVRANQKIKILPQTIVTKIIGNETLESIELKNTKSVETLIYPTNFLLLRLGVEPNTELLKGKLKLDENGYCLIDSQCQTQVKNVYAIGDVANPMAPTISAAVGMGALALKNLRQSIV